ncbi:uroporphyrinogen-III synthase [Aliiroseovarius sp. S1339]|uniref:uroporphyrinogen-III synthase n=1 Tax=Aliiroseovarius sp. S1339 TaxID=2936990 RepID=UPI0020C18447|nr:uroporphyrinogen-III synthase [Aliiroseovarius sp. S1339]MCK8463333.1 uroporphyrinogen-III synthase [Aliiroseovarius sp. S1339]
MSTPKTLVLTRPDISSAQVLGQIEAAVGAKVHAVLSPILKIVPGTDWPDLSPYDVVIATSVHAIHGPLTGKPVFCVGVRTAEAATKAGGNVRHCALDAAALIAWIRTQPNPGKIVYLRGSHVATDIPAALAELSIEGCAFQTYRQAEQPLSQTAREVIEGDRPAILPLFSPRSARLVGKAIGQTGCDLHVIAISDAAAEAWHGQTAETARGSCEVVDQPTGEAMVSRIVAALQR